MQDDTSATVESPFNALPPVVLALAALAIGVEAVLSLGSAGIVGGPGAVGWRLGAISDYGFSPLVWEQVAARGDASYPMLRRFVTYTFVHGSFTQALFGIALLLALGKFVGDVFSSAALLLLVALCSVAGAAAFGIVFDGPVPLVGLYPAVYGLIGAFTYLMWLKLGTLGENRLRAFRLIGVLMAIQLVFALLFHSNPVWVAEVAGFAAGFVASVILAPGGWTAFVARMRSR